MVEFEYNKLNNKYYLHDLVDGWKTSEITKKEYTRFKKQGFISCEEKYNIQGRKEGLKE